MPHDEDDDGPVSVLRFRMTLEEYLLGHALAGAMAASPYRRDWADMDAVGKAAKAAAVAALYHHEHES